LHYIIQSIKNKGVKMKGSSKKQKKKSEYTGVEPEIVEILKNNKLKEGGLSEIKNNSGIEKIIKERRESWGLNNYAITPYKSKGNLVYIVGHTDELKKIHLAMKWKINENKSVFYRTASAAVDFFRINVFGKNYTIDQIMGMEEDHLSEINSTLILMTSNLKQAHENLVSSRNKKGLITGAKVLDNDQLREELFKTERDYKIVERKLINMRPGDKFYFDIRCISENLERKRSELLQKLHLNQGHIVDYISIDENLKKIEKIVQVYLFLSEELIDQTKRVLDFTKVTRPVYDPLMKQAGFVKLLLNNVHYLEEYTYDVNDIIGGRLREISQIESNPRSLARRYRNSNQLLSSVLDDISNAYDMKLINRDRMTNNYLKGK